MPIDEKELLRYVDELGLSDAVKAQVLQELKADEKRATQFVGQRLRQDDYTKKTTDLAQQRKDLETTAQTAVSQAVQEYAGKLQGAEEKANKILKDLENERITRNTAEQRLLRLKEQYQLSDDDIPPLNAGGGNPQPRVEIDLDTKLGEFETRVTKQIKETLVKELMPELMAFPRISAIQGDIIAEHLALTGKRLTAADMAKLTELAPKVGGLQKAWEQEYGIADIRMQNHDKELTAKNRQTWEDEQKAKASEAALATVAHVGQDGKPLSTSPVLRPYQNRDGDSPLEPGKAAGNGNQNGGHGEPKLSGAERAAVKWVEKANKGLIGKPA